MNAILIRNLEPSLFESLKEQAARLQLSVNQLVKTLLAQALAQNPTATRVKSKALQPKNDLLKFAGGWTQADVREFEAATANTREIDPQMWK